LTKLARAADDRPSLDVTNLLIGSDVVKAVLGGVGWMTVEGRGVGPMFSEWLEASYSRAAAVALANVALLFCGLWWIYSGRMHEIGKVRGWRGSREGLRVFLCHCSEDKPTVRKLHERLLADGFTPWLDEEEIRGGREWEREIEQALDESHAIVICLSRDFVVKTGYVQKEVREAVRLAAYRPSGDIYVIPVRLEDCPIPPDLKALQCIDLFRDGCYERLVEVLRERARQVHPEPGASAAAAG
jgi:TIR domain